MSTPRSTHDGWELLEAQDDLEPERYELAEGPAYEFEFERRDFLKTVGGGFVVLLLVDAGTSQTETLPFAFQQNRQGRAPREIGAWLHIGEDGSVTAYSGKVEVGQDIRTSLAQAVAEELRIPVPSVRMVLGDTKRTPYDRGTFGSRTTPAMSRQLRRAAVATRELLRAKAAKRFHVSRDAVSIDAGKLVHADSGRSCSFAELTKGQKLMQAIDADVKMTPATDWKVMGRKAPRVGADAIVTGRHTYASDVRRKGMLHGKVLRPPAFGAERASVDVAAAKAIEGVTVVVDGDFVGVAAKTPEIAADAIATIKATWKTTPQPSHVELFEHLKKNASGAWGRGRRGRGRRGRPMSTGSMREGLAAAAEKLDQTYTCQFIAHAPLEPRVAVAEWKGDELTVWTGTQRPFGVQSDLSRAFRVASKKVRVIVPDTGSGYGGKHNVEAAIEAARLAKAAGRPVKVAWTREEEFTWAYFRPAGVVEVRSGVTKAGRLTAWEFHDYNAGSSGMRTLYDVANQKVLFHRTSSPLRQGSYRALASTMNHFARESHIDELAHAVGMDPLAFRLKNLSDQRLIDVLKAAARRFGWAKRKKAQGRGFGLAVGSEKGGYVANCVEFAGGEVVRAVTAFECGAIVNPDNLRNQVEGAVIMGLGGALTEAIRFKDGKILNPRFSQYRVPRFSVVPVLETVLLDRKDLPSAGAGEAPIVTIAPAIGNAIFDATDKRHRSLPMV